MSWRTFIIEKQALSFHTCMGMVAMSSPALLVGSPPCPTTTSLGYSAAVGFRRSGNNPLCLSRIQIQRVLRKENKEEFIIICAWHHHLSAVSDTACTATNMIYVFVGAKSAVVMGDVSKIWYILGCKSITLYSDLAISLIIPLNSKLAISLVIPLNNKLALSH